MQHGLAIDLCSQVASCLCVPSLKHRQQIAGYKLHSQQVKDRPQACRRCMSFVATSTVGPQLLEEDTVLSEGDIS
jgi:hypothetical protein